MNLMQDYLTCMRRSLIMTEKLDIYRCPTCGNIVQILNPGNGELVCCGQAMEHLIPQYKENEVGEKHVPQVIAAWDGCNSGICNERKFVVLDKHPMSKEHYIQFIEVCSASASEVRIKFFNPEEKPEYEVTEIHGDIKVKEYCNIHGLWRGKND